jgi:hypothetical protein
MIPPYIGQAQRAEAVHCIDGSTRKQRSARPSSLEAFLNLGPTVYELTSAHSSRPAAPGESEVFRPVALGAEDPPE